MYLVIQSQNSKYFRIIICPISELEILLLNMLSNQWTWNTFTAVSCPISELNGRQHGYLQWLLFDLSDLSDLSLRLRQSGSLSSVQSQCGVNDIPAFAGQAIGCNELIIPVNSAILNIRCFKESNFKLSLTVSFVFFFFFIIKPEVINTRIFRVKMFDFLIYWIIKRWNLNCAAY